MSTNLEVLRRVYDDNKHFITVRPWPEAPNTVSLNTCEKDNAEYFGLVNFSMSPDFARDLGNALIACASEVEADED